MPERHVEFIAGCATNVQFPEGHMIFREGDPASEFYFIREGLVSVELLVPHRGAITIRTVAEGEVLGWSWVSPPYRWHFGARTAQRTRALVFDARCLRDKCEEDHDLGYELLSRFVGIISARLDAVRLQLLDVYSRQ
jgi:CRP-like cAMP-binding protein